MVAPPDMTRTKDRKRNRTRRRLPLLIAAAVILFLFGWMSRQGYFFSINKILQSAFFVGSEVRDDIVIVTIDDETISTIGRYPLPRSRYGDLLERIRVQSPKAIGLDVTFSEESIPAEDDALAAQLRLTKEQGITVALSTEVSSLNQTDRGLVARSVLGAIPSFAAHSTRGVVSVFLDQDQAVRRMPVPIHVAGEDGTLETLLPFTTVLLQAGESEQRRSTWIDPEMLNVDHFIRFAGSTDRFRSISMKEVLAGNAPVGLFSQRYVLIGATANNLHDESRTPIGTIPGITIQANMLNTMLLGNWLVDASPWIQWTLLALMAFIPMVALWGLRLRWALPLSIFMIVVYAVVAGVLFEAGIILDFLYPVMALMTSLTVGLALQYLLEGREKAQMRRHFEAYVAPEVVHAISENPELATLGGARKELTVLFSDIRGFTSLSEKISPERLVHVLNQYLTEMSDVVMREGGLIDKYIGDAIMAIWGAPIETVDHPARAARAALGMIEALDRIRGEWRSVFGTDIAIGIGINTGEMIVGNVGSEKRFDYTVIGDNVNLASRLESLTKKYGAAILLSDHTATALGDDFLIRPVEVVAVKGREGATTLYELVGSRDRLGVWSGGRLTEWQELWARYSAGEVEAASGLLTAYLARFPDDSVATLLAERIESRPEDGVWRLDAK